MRIRHLNCISTCPLGGRIMDGRSLGVRGRLTNHCLLVETDAGLVLVDTGLGLRDVADPRGRLSHFFLALVSPDFREDLTAVRQIEALGYAAADVRHIVLTHLDFDHAGGLDDFPNATVHMMARERESALARKTRLDKMRYRPQQWSTQANWRTYSPSGGGERWHGFEMVRALDGLPPDILLVPLFGHTLGHAGVAVRGNDGWILDAGDVLLPRGDGRQPEVHAGPPLLPDDDGEGPRGAAAQPASRPRARAGARGPSLLLARRARVRTAGRACSRCAPAPRGAGRRAAVCRGISGALIRGGSTNQ